jgi:hypothetical protein
MISTIVKRNLDNRQKNKTQGFGDVTSLEAVTTRHQGLQVQYLNVIESTKYSDTLTSYQKNSLCLPLLIVFTRSWIRSV